MGHQEHDPSNMQPNGDFSEPCQVASSFIPDSGLARNELEHSSFKASVVERQLELDLTENNAGFNVKEFFHKNVRVY